MVEFDLDVVIREQKQLATARADFLQIRQHLVEQRVVGQRADHRHVGINQRQRAVLQFAGRIGLGVDIRDFLQLQRAFQRDRIERTATEEQRVMLVGKGFRHVLDRIRQRQHHFNLARQCMQFVDQAFFIFHRQAASPRQRDREQPQCGELGGECLGRSDTDFRPGAGHQRDIGFPRQRRFRHVADGQRTDVAGLLGEAQSGQGVGCLAGL